MAFTYDPTTDAGRVRLLIFDTDTVTAANQIFSDAEIDAFLDMEDTSVRRAAALALETIATQEVLIQKVVRNMDLQTDGARVSAELRARAKSLREQEEQGLEDGGFDWAESIYDVFTYRDRIIKEALRNGS